MLILSKYAQNMLRVHIIWLLLSLRAWQLLGSYVIGLGEFHRGLGEFPQQANGIIAWKHWNFSHCRHAFCG